MRPFGSPSIGCSLAVVLGLGAVGACAPAAPAVSPAFSAAIHGVVALTTTREDGETTLCSGALVAPNLVLTARHCVARTVTTTPTCDVRGRSHNGAHLTEDVDPSRVAVHIGPRVPGAGPPAARGLSTVHPTSPILCDSDVAFVVLDRDVPLPVLPMRLAAGVRVGDWVVPVGFGGGPSGDVGVRVPRRASRVLFVGPGRNPRTGAVLGPRELEVEAETCRGDSGGPALDLVTGEIVGVISRGGSCDRPGNHVYTRLDAFSRLAALSLAAARRAEETRLAATRARAPGPGL
jgi:hypothetical protein